MKKRSRRWGFTTVELVIVIAVIAILATILIPIFSNLMDKANESAALQEASSILMHYSIDNAANLGAKRDFFIKAKGYYFKVSNGALQKDGTNTAPTEIGAIIISSDTDAPYYKAEPITEPTTEPVTEPATEPETEPATEPETEPATEPVTEPATEPVTEPATEPPTEPPTEPEGGEDHIHAYDARNGDKCVCGAFNPNHRCYDVVNIDYRCDICGKHVHDTETYNAKTGWCLFCKP